MIVMANHFDSVVYYFVALASFVAAIYAKTKIKSTLREEKFKEAEAGKELLKRRLKNWKIKFEDAIIDR